MDLSRPTVFFSAKVAIMKVKSATILFFLFSFPFFLFALSFSPQSRQNVKHNGHWGRGGECGMPLKESRCRNVIQGLFICYGQGRRGWGQAKFKMNRQVSSFYRASQNNPGGYLPIIGSSTEWAHIFQENSNLHNLSQIFSSLSRLQFTYLNKQYLFITKIT